MLVNEVSNLVARQKSNEEIRGRIDMKGLQLHKIRKGKDKMIKPVSSKFIVLQIYISIFPHNHH